MHLRRSCRILATATTALALTLPAIVAAAPAESVPTAATSARVRQLLAQMTLPEKIAVISGTMEDPATYQGQSGTLGGVPRLGIPKLRLADGPPGVLTREVSAALPGTMALAATFDAADAQALGVVIGSNAKARGIHVSLQPFINLYRDPKANRGYNTFGEDPYLAGRMGAGLVTGIQSQGVMAMAKHLVGYDGGSDVVVGGQALREVYMAPFAAAVDAGVASVMCAYNKINGPYSCDSDAIQNGILRGELGFKGFVTSDWGGVHGAEFINSGLDLEMPGDLGNFPLADMLPSYFNLRRDPKPMRPPDLAFLKTIIPGKIPEELVVKTETPGMAMPGMTTRETLQAGKSHSLAAALQAGTVHMAAIDRAAGRILTQMEAFGFLDGAARQTVTPENVAANAVVSQRVAERSAVLLKNDDGILPLSTDASTAIALIGPAARQAMAVLRPGEKALGYTERQAGPDHALGLRGAAVIVAPDNDMDGVTIPADRLSHGGTPGLIQQTAGAASGVAGSLDYTLANGRALAKGTTAKWTGELDVPADDDYDLNLQILGAFGSVMLDGELVGQTSNLLLHGDTLQAGQDNILPTTDGLDNIRRRVHLKAGKHPLEVEIRPDTSDRPAQVRLNWNTPAKRVADRQAAIDAAKKAKVAVVFAWYRGEPDPFRLPGDQDALIEQVAAANPNVVVVLNGGQPVAMPWLRKVKAVVQTWNTGDEGGAAVADVLTSKSYPGGRLPFTWPNRLEDFAADDPAHPERASREDGGKTVYSEGVLIGYRWFDDQNIKPLFPFGYCMTYTRFGYSGLKVVKAPDGGRTVSFTVRNLGKATGDAVPQLYLGAPKSRPADGQFAPKVLAGFDRLTLAPGQQRTVTLTLKPRQLEYWSEQAKAWRRPKSARAVYVGENAADLQLQSVID